MQLVIGNTYQSSRGFGRLTYIGETHDIDGYLPTFRKQDGGIKFYRHDDLPSALVEFAVPTISRADELIACLEGEVKSRDARIAELEKSEVNLRREAIQIRAVIMAQEPAEWEVYYADDDSFHTITREKMLIEGYSKMAYTIKPLYAAPVAKQVVMPELSGLIRVEATIQESGDGVSDCPGSMDGETNACFYFTTSGQLIHCAVLPESSLNAADQEGGQDE